MSSAEKDSAAAAAAAFIIANDSTTSSVATPVVVSSDSPSSDHPASTPQFISKPSESTLIVSSATDSSQLPENDSQNEKDLKNAIAEEEESSTQQFSSLSKVEFGLVFFGLALSVFLAALDQVKMK